MEICKSSGIYQRTYRHIMPDNANVHILRDGIKRMCSYSPPRPVLAWSYEDAPDANINGFVDHVGLSACPVLCNYKNLKTVLFQTSSVQHKRVKM